MNGMERIASKFENNKKIALMTHIVGGYPNYATSVKLLKKMAASGVDLIEVQIPFSDPIADGPTIVEANYKALDAGMKTEKVFELIAEVTNEVDVPILIMSYINPIFSYGVEKFVKRAVDVGVTGFIIPDLPPEEELPELAALAKKGGLAFVPLVTPKTSDERMKFITKIYDSPFVYAVLRLGVTGAKTSLGKDIPVYLQRIKDSTNKKVAAGFGIKEKSQLDLLTGQADCGVIGSELLRVINGAIAQDLDPVDAVGDFISSLLV